MLGLSIVSIPVTLALVLTATGSSDVLTVGAAHGWTVAGPPAQSARLGACRPIRGYYALTFEDGPLPGRTPRLVNALRDAGATATFFDLGSRAAAHPGLVALQRGVGQVGSHAYTHVPLAGLGPGERVEQLQATAAVLRYPNRLFRPPDGATTPLLEADVRASGLQTILWTVDPLDRARGVRAVVVRAASVRPGGIVRLHEGSTTAIAAVPAIVRTLRRRGMCPGRVASSIFGLDGAVVRATAVRP